MIRHNKVNDNHPDSKSMYRALFRIFCLTFVLATALVSAPSAKALVLGSATDNLDGTFTYSYRVDNSSGLFDIAIWSLEFPFAAPDWDQLDTFSGGDLSVPDPNWFADAGIPVSGQSAQDFISLDPVADVVMGTVLDGFSFASAFAPGTINYHEFSLAGDSISGSTIGPAIAQASVPDAGQGTVVLGLSFLLALFRLRDETCLPAFPRS